MKSTKKKQKKNNSKQKKENFNKFYNLFLAITKKLSLTINF